MVAVAIFLFAAKPALAACPLEKDKPYRSTYSNAVFYITEKCTKRPFSSARVFFTYFDSWQQVRVTTANTLNSIKTEKIGAMTLGPKYNPGHGSLFKLPKNTKVYVLLDGKISWIKTEKIFKDLGYDFRWVEEVDEAFLKKYQKGADIAKSTPRPVGFVFKYQGFRKVYRLEVNPMDKKTMVKVLIPDVETFEKLGYRWDRIVEIPELEIYKTLNKVL